MPENALRSYNRYLQGDRDALDILVRTYSDALVRYAYCYLNDSAASEDVMEETIATLIFRHRHFADADHFNAYLYPSFLPKKVIWTPPSNTFADR